MPYRQVIRSQAIADSSAAMTRSWVAAVGGTIPLPMVVATAVPVRAPTMLRAPAISTAVPGASTRVATEVAIALAVSWKPLMKSKTSPIATIKMSMTSAKLGILYHNPFQGVGNVLGTVGGILQVLVDLSPTEPLNQAMNIIDSVELPHECLVEYVVGLVLKPLDVDRALEQVIPLPLVFQVWYCSGDDFRLVINNASQQSSMLSWLVQAVEPYSSDLLFAGIAKVFEPPCQISDILAVERRHAGTVKCVEDLVGDLVTPVFKVLHSSGLALNLTVVVKQIAQGQRDLCDVRDIFAKVVKKALILGKEAC